MSSSRQQRTIQSTANNGDEEEVGSLLYSLDTVPANVQQQDDEDADIESGSESNVALMPPSAQPRRRMTTDSPETSRTEASTSRRRSLKSRGRPTKKQKLALDVVDADEEMRADDEDGRFWPAAIQGSASSSTLYSDNARELGKIFTRHVDRVAWNLLQKRKAGSTSDGVDPPVDEEQDHGDDALQKGRESPSASSIIEEENSPQPDSASISSAASSISFNAHEDDEPDIQPDNEENGMADSDDDLKEASQQHTLLDPSLLRPLSDAIGSSMSSLFKHLHEERQRKVRMSKDSSSALDREDILRVIEGSHTADDVVDRVKARLGVAVAEKQPSGQSPRRRRRNNLDRELLLGIKATRK